jgi:hypothetical protein
MSRHCFPLTPGVVNFGTPLAATPELRTVHPIQRLLALKPFERFPFGYAQGKQSAQDLQMRGNDSD